MAGTRLTILVCFCLLSGYANVASAQTVTILYSFAASPDSQNPLAGLVQGSDGNFYGTTDSGGTSNKDTVYRITPGGSLSNLHS